MTEDALIIGGKGGKGGGGGSYTPTEASDNLNSKASVEIIDLLGEGEIEGFATPSKAGLTRGSAAWNTAMLKDIYFDNTPILRSGASNTAPATTDYNFKNVGISARYGTQAQTAVNLNTSSGSAANEIAVGLVVEKALPVVRTITDKNVDAVRVTITIPQLQTISDQGDINGATIHLRIFVQYNGGGYVVFKDDVITGRTSDSYQRDYMLNLSGEFPVDIKVQRLTDDSTSAKLANAFNWTSYTEILAEKFRYPNSALIGIRANADQFSQIPVRSYRVRGLKVSVPSNATVDAATGRITYSGVWDGTFGSAQWTSDPAWCLWNLLTNKRYGFGDYITASTLDKWAFYAASQYCNELVPTGFGGTEPRFSMNCLIQTQEEAYKLINDLCSVFRAMPYWSTGTLTIAQDKPADSSYLFTLANVTEEGFSYSGSDSKTRPTVAVVSYLDLNTREMAYEIVEDRTAISKYGVQTVEVSAFACTSRGQANRLGEWLLYSSQYETEVVSFTASIDAGVMVRPGQVIEIADPARAGVRRGGRIESATTTVITVDNASGLPAIMAGGSTIAVILKDGTVESRTVSTYSGRTVVVASAFSSAPAANSVWVFSGSGVSTTLWRVLTIQEQDGSNYGITALSYNPSKYAYIERDRPLQQRKVSALNDAPAAPRNLQATEALYESNGRALVKIITSWRPVVGISQYRVLWRRLNGNWNSELVPRPDYEILDTAATQYEIRVFSVSAANKPSIEPATLTFQARGKTAAPVAVTGLYANIIDPQTVELAWNLHPDLDVRVGGKILIRHTPRTTAAEWANASTIVPAIAGNQTRKNVPFVAGTYLLRAQDDLGNLSPTATSIVVSAQARPQAINVVRVGSSPASKPDLTFAEDLTSPRFQGNRTNMLYSRDLDGLILANGVEWDSLPGLVDDYTRIDAAGGIAATGEYEFGSTLDLGAVFEVNLRGRFVTRAFNPGNLWDDYGLIDDLATIDDVVGNPDAQLLFRYSTDAIAYSDWIPYQANLVRGRTFQFKVVATSGDQRENILIEELGMTALLQQQSQVEGPLTSGAATYTATFENAFYSAPRVSVTALDMATGDYAQITNVTRTGFQVTFRNSGGTAVSRQFHYLATGYGKEIP